MFFIFALNYWTNMQHFNLAIIVFLFVFTFSKANNLIPCNSSISFCDLLSTECVVSNQGNVTCTCKLGFQRYNSSLCAVSPICFTNSECNHPFGICSFNLSNLGQCSCNWGFVGDGCERGWLFIFTIVTSLCGAIILCLVAYVIYMKRKHPTLAEPLTPTFQPPIPGPSYSFSNFPRAHFNEEGLVEDAPKNDLTLHRNNESSDLSNGKYAYANAAYDRQDSKSFAKNPTTNGAVFRPANYF